MFKSLDIQKHMEVVGSDNQHVGKVDHVLEGAQEILLAKEDSRSGGMHHIISVDWVDFVDQKVHLNKPSKAAMSEWQSAA